MKTIKHCSLCGSEFQTKNCKQLYCSRPCYSHERHKHSCFKGRVLSCATCGVEFKVSPSSKRKYCSEECRIAVTNSEGGRWITQNELVNRSPIKKRSKLLPILKSEGVLPVIVFGQLRYNWEEAKVVISGLTTKRTCQECKSGFDTTRAKMRFCCSRCQMESYNKRRKSDRCPGQVRIKLTSQKLSKSKPAQKKHSPKPIKYCAECGSSISGNRNYCSEKCCSEHHNEMKCQAEQKRRQSFEAMNQMCSVCGTSIQYNPIGSLKRKFCSERCGNTAFGRARYKRKPFEFRFRARVHKALKQHGARKLCRIKDLIGCTIDQLRSHLESLFVHGMTWENREDWHIDHKIPCAAFDLTKQKQQRQCFHYSNLQPLWKSDNLAKGAKTLKQAALPL